MPQLRAAVLLALAAPLAACSVPDPRKQAGGNAITNLNCEEPKKNSLTNVCYESIRCTAKAIRLLN